MFLIFFNIFQIYFRNTSCWMIICPSLAGLSQKKQMIGVYVGPCGMVHENPWIPWIPCSLSPWCLDFHDPYGNTYPWCLDFHFHYVWPLYIPMIKHNFPFPYGFPFPFHYVLHPMICFFFPMIRRKQSSRPKESWALWKTGKVHLRKVSGTFFRKFPWFI